MSDGLGILLALAAVIVPLVLAWFLISRTIRHPGPSHSHSKTKRKP